MLDDREAEPGPAQLAAPGLVDPVKPLEDARQVGAGDADAGVGDLDLAELRSLWQVTETEPPSGVYLMALSIRLSTIWRMASSSARTRVSSSIPPGSKMRCRFLLWARSRCASTHDSRTGTRYSGSVLEDLLSRLEAGEAQEVEDQLVEPLGLLVDPLEEPSIDGLVVKSPVHQRLGIGLDEASGVLSSCDALATKSWRMRSSRRSSVTSWKTKTAPVDGWPGRGLPRTER